MEPGEVLTELALIDTRWQGVWPSKTATLSSRSRRSENSSGRQRLDGMAGLAGTPVLLEAALVGALTAQLRRPRSRSATAGLRRLRSVDVGTMPGPRRDGRGIDEGIAANGVGQSRAIGNRIRR
jgi:hypothetical protein